MYITAENKKKPPYQPGLDRWTLYKDIWIKHWNGFQKIYDERFLKIYGKLTDEKKAEVKKLIGCGNYLNGFERHICLKCKTQFIVPFTCKSRLCLSCYRKKLFGWSVNLSQILNTSLTHSHITYTLPASISKSLFEKGFQSTSLIKLASMLYQREARKYAGNLSKEWMSGMIGTLHKAGNGLNYSPHCHIVATRELVNVKTGEISKDPFIPYDKIRILWMKTILRHLVRNGYISSKDSKDIKNKYKYGFHVFFQPIAGNEEDLLFRTAEYMATGFFHNSQILKVDHEKREIIFRYKNWVDRKTRKKSYANKKLDIYEFMARMLFFLPERHQKNIRYYGLYAISNRKEKKEIERCTWAKAIEHSFNRDPKICPDCGNPMQLFIVFSSSAYSVIRRIRKNYSLKNGYFRLKETANSNPLPCPIRF